MNKDRFINIILLIGVILGATLASISLVKETNFRSEGDWVAKVEEVEIIYYEDAINDTITTYVCL